MKKSLFKQNFFPPLIRSPERVSVCGYLGKTSQEQHSVTENVFSCSLDTLLAPWIHFCRPGYTYVALDTLKSPWIHLCHPGYTMSPWIHLCHPGYPYVALDTLMSPWIHLCCPRYTYVALVTPKEVIKEQPTPTNLSATARRVLQCTRSH